MSRSGKIACGALAVTVICGILGLIGLVVFGVDTINQTDAVLPEPGLDAGLLCITCGNGWFHTCYDCRISKEK